MLSPYPTEHRILLLRTSFFIRTLGDSFRRRSSGWNPESASTPSIIGWVGAYHIAYRNDGSPDKTFQCGKWKSRSMPPELNGMEAKKTLVAASESRH